jgi:hypothetical protein
MVPLLEMGITHLVDYGAKQESHDRGGAPLLWGDDRAIPVTALNTPSSSL